MKSSLVAVLCLAFGIRTPGQTSTTYDTGKGHGTPLIPTVQSEVTEHVARRNGYLALLRGAKDACPTSHQYLGQGHYGV